MTERALICPGCEQPTLTDETEGVCPKCGHDYLDGPCYDGCMCSRCKDGWAADPYAACSCLRVSRLISDCILHPSIFDTKETA